LIRGRGSIFERGFAPLTPLLVSLSPQRRGGSIGFEEAKPLHATFYIIYIMERAEFM